jgi:hypothetical protein
MQRSTEGGCWFALRHPEGSGIQLEQSASADAITVPSAIRRRIIAVGYAVHDRAKQHGLYRRLFGFRSYWRGASERD